MVDHLAVARRRREDVEACGGGQRDRRYAGAVCRAQQEGRGTDRAELSDYRDPGGRARRLSGSIACYRPRGSKAMSSIRRRLRPRAGGAGQRPTNSTGRRWFGHCRPISGANRGCARCSGCRFPTKRTASRVSARRLGTSECDTSTTAKGCHLVQGVSGYEPLRRHDRAAASGRC